jgi:CRISPR/Cas system-associated exonuclease Cas4 (RecB family)
MEEPIGESQAVEIFESHVGQSLDETPVVFKKGEDSASMLSKGKDLISLLFKRERANRVLLVEHPLESELIDDQGVVSDIVLFGILDLVEEDEEGNRIIIDLKTSGSRYDDFRVQTDQQLTFYAELAAENQLVPQEGALLRFDVLLKQKVPSLESYYAVRSVNDRRRMRKTIFRVLEAIEQGIFYPVPGFTCGDCGYKSLCMDW